MVVLNFDTCWQMAFLCAVCQIAFGDSVESFPYAFIFCLYDCTAVRPFAFFYTAPVVCTHACISSGEFVVDRLCSLDVSAVVRIDLG